LEFIVKVSRLGGKTVIMGVAVGDDKTASFGIKTEDFTSAGFFPWNDANHEKHVTGGFIGENRIKDLTGLFKINILQKLIPGLDKTGYTEDQGTESTIQTYFPNESLTLVNAPTQDNVLNATHQDHYSIRTMTTTHYVSLHADHTIPNPCQTLKIPTTSTDLVLSSHKIIRPQSAMTISILQE
jgi:hypothetical protein